MTDIQQAFNRSPNGGIVFIRGHINEKTGGVSDFFLNTRIDYQRLLQRSMESLQLFDAINMATDCPACADLIEGTDTTAAERLAFDAMLSVRESLTRRINGSSKKSSPFLPLAPSLQTLAKDPGSALYVYGLLQYKRTIKSGVHKQVRSNSLTLAKRWIERGLPISRYRIVKLTPGNFQDISVSGSRFTPSELFKPVGIVHPTAETA
jgi:hypothetical protein